MIAQEDNDTELVSRSLAGDRDAFSRIVSRYQTLICSLAYSRIGNLGQSEDVAQETFITAWKHRAIESSSFLIADGRPIPSYRQKDVWKKMEDRVRSILCFRRHEQSSLASTIFCQTSFCQYLHPDAALN
jgi:hypothetical protein